MQSKEANNESKQVRKEESVEILSKINAVSFTEKKFEGDAKHDGDRGEEGIFGGGFGIEASEAAGDDCGARA